MNLVRRGRLSSVFEIKDRSGHELEGAGCSEEAAAEGDHGLREALAGVGVGTPPAGNSNSSGRLVDATSVGDKEADGIRVGEWIDCWAISWSRSSCRFNHIGWRTWVNKQTNRSFTSNAYERALELYTENTLYVLLLAASKFGSEGSPSINNNSPLILVGGN